MTIRCVACTRAASPSASTSSAPSARSISTACQVRSGSSACATATSATMQVWAPQRCSRRATSEASMLCGVTSMIDCPVRSGAANGFCSPSRSGERNRHLEGRAGAELALQRDAAAHALDDPLGDAQAEPRAAIAPRDALVGLLELAEDPRLRFRRDADAGVAHQKADLARPDAGLDDQRHAAGRGELDGVAGQIEQHLPQPRGVADHFAPAAARRHRQRSRAFAPAPAAPAVR